MKRNPTLIAALIMCSSLTVVGEPDHQLRAFLSINSVSAKVKIDAPAHYFEIFVFKGGKQLARLPTVFTSDPARIEIEASLMYNDKGIVKFVSGGSTSDLSDKLDWLEVLKPGGGKGWQTGTTDKPIGMIDGVKVIGLIQGEQHGKGTTRHKIQSDFSMDESISQRIENAESCVLIAFRSGTGEELLAEWSKTHDDNTKQNKSEQATPRKPPD